MFNFVSVRDEVFHSVIGSVTIHLNIQNYTQLVNLKHYSSGHPDPTSSLDIHRARGVDHTIGHKPGERCLITLCSSRLVTSRVRGVDHVWSQAEPNTRFFFTSG